MDELRIGDRDREEAVGVLGEQYALGRLTKDELDERCDAVWSARTRSDLAPLFADLPVRVPGSVAVARSGPRAAPAPSYARPGWQGVGRFVVPVAFLLLALTVLTHLPFVLLAIVLWCVLGRRAGWHGHHRRW